MIHTSGNQQHAEPTWARTARLLREKAEAADSDARYYFNCNQDTSQAMAETRAQAMRDAADIVEREGRAGDGN